MQSFLQYRRFRDAAKAQIERDKERSSRNGARDDVDVEKGQDFNQAPVNDSGQHGGSNDVSPVDDDSRKVTDSQELSEEKLEEEEALDEDDDDDYELGQHARNTISRTTTQQSAGTALGMTLTGIEVRRRTTREGGDGNVFVVGYESPDDPNDPHNWSTWRRLGCTVPIAGIGAVVGFASAIDSAALPQAAKEFGVSEVVESLATGLFLIGEIHT